MSKTYALTCIRQRHVHTLSYEELVKLFGKARVEAVDAGTDRYPLYVSECMECDEEDEQKSTENDIGELGLQMSAHDE